MLFSVCLIAPALSPSVSSLRDGDSWPGAVANGLSPRCLSGSDKWVSNPVERL